MQGPFKAAVARGLILTDSKQKEVILILMTMTDVETYRNNTTLYCGSV
jgi:hypothetical protein